MVSSSSILRSTDSSGHQPMVSARAPGVSTSRQQAAHAATSDLLEQGPSRGPVFASELGDVSGGGPVRGVGRVVDGLGLDPQGIAGADHAGTHGGALHRPHHEGGGAVRERPAILDLGDHADAAVAAVDPRDQENLVLLAHGLESGLGFVGLDRDRHDHAGEHGAR